MSQEQADGYHLALYRLVSQGLAEAIATGMAQVPILLHSTALYSTLLHSIALYFTLLHSIALYCTLLHYIELQCIVIYCMILCGALLCYRNVLFQITVSIPILRIRCYYSMKCVYNY